MVIFPVNHLKPHLRHSHDYSDGNKQVNIEIDRPWNQKSQQRSDQIADAKQDFPAKFLGQNAARYLCNKVAIKERGLDEAL